MWKKNDCLPLIACVAIACLALLCRSGAAFTNEPDGVMGIRWGTAIGSAEGLVNTGEGEDGTRFYVRHKESPVFLGVAIDGIVYGFREKGLVTVTVTVKNLRSFVLLRDALFARYGRGRDLSPRAERYIWEGDRTTILLMSRFDIS